MKSTNRIHRNGAAKAAKSQVETPAEFKIVRLRECPVESPEFDSPPAVEAFWRQRVVNAPWFNGDKECLCVFLLNTRKRLIGFELVSQGNLDTVLMHPRDVFRLAAMHGAAGITIAHNHPSGDPSPSDADIKVTRDLIQAAGMIKIEMVDHVIIGDARSKMPFCSLRELGHFLPEALPTENKTRINSMDVRSAAEEVRTAVEQSNVLMELIEVHLDHREHRSGEDFIGERANKFNFGLAMLADTTRKRLDKAAQAIMEAAYSKKLEVAS